MWAEKMKIAVVGMGYVGLPLAVEFSKKNKVVGFDKNSEKIALLKKGIDPTESIEDFSSNRIEFTDDPKGIKAADFVIAAVPTPTKNGKPDLSYVISASEIIGENLKKGATVIYESTVYPGCTEELCRKIIEEKSGFIYPKDFSLAYSPERINVGDKKHTLTGIVKIVSANDPATTKRVAELYSSIIKAGIYIAPDIKTAECAKLIENIQRDVNIALMNEFAVILNRTGINSKEVLKAAGTKWNFLPFTPGLVGGHCISEDPYYFIEYAEKKGMNPKLMNAAREINNGLPKEVCKIAVEKASKILKKEKIRACVLGLTFKEDVNDYRNSLSKKLIEELENYSDEVFYFDPFIDAKTTKEQFGSNCLEKVDLDKFNLFIIAVPHRQFLGIDFSRAKKEIVLFDIKGKMNKEKMPKNVHYFSL